MFLSFAIICHKGTHFSSITLDKRPQNNIFLCKQHPLMNEAEVLVLAAPIYYFTLCAQIQAPIQRMYCVNKPANVKKIIVNGKHLCHEVLDVAG